MTHLLFTVRFLDDRYHGLLDRGGPPEWPPSPFRLFQALVAGVARRGELVEGKDICLCDSCKEARKRSGKNEPDDPTATAFTPIGQALDWLQRHTRDHPPIIIAPKAKAGQAITRFVPNNDSDKKFDRQERLTAKPTIPTLFLLKPDQKPEVYYVWDIAGKNNCPVTNIERAARSLTTLGWGIDMAFADARLAGEAELQTLQGIRWYPKKNAGSFEETLRTPTYDDEMGECTLCDLRHCHTTFINRIEHGKPLKTVDKPKVFNRVMYTSVERPEHKPYAVFKLLDENEDTFRYPHAKLIHIAGMVRHLARECLLNQPPHDLRGMSYEDWLRAWVLGHQSPTDKVARKSHSQLSFVPLPSVGTEHTDPSVRRFMLVAPVGDADWLNHVANRITGPLLTPLPGTKLPPGSHLERVADRAKDGVRDAYLRPSSKWASITPVILDCHPKRVEREDRKTGKKVMVWNHDEIICLALKRAGIETPCEFTWSAFSYFRKALSAHKYRKDPNNPSKKILINYVRPGHLVNNAAVHVVLDFHDGSKDKRPIEIPGPLTLGAGRHCGFGLFAAVDANPNTHPGE